MNLLLYGVVALAILGAIGGLYGTVHHSGVAEGRAEVQKAWDAANAKAQERRDANRMAAELIAKTSAGELAAAQQKATDYQSKWRAERAKHSDSSLAGCSGSPTPNATDPAGTQPSTPSVRFSAGFLRDWNAGWTGDKGEPLLPDQPAIALIPADTLTSVGPGEVLDNQHANAETCSADRLKLDSLIGQIEKLRAGWH